MSMTPPAVHFPLKDTLSTNPLRFLEIYSDGIDCQKLRSQLGANPRLSPVVGPLAYNDVRTWLFPRIPGQEVHIGEGIHLPPFCWSDADAKKLCVSFTYNVNAFYRILRNLSAEGKTPENQIGNLLDQACLMLAQIYKAGNFHVIKNINNNFNMYLVSRVIEELLGRHIYCSEEQELTLTTQSLATALKMVPGFLSYSPFEKMGFALGMGVAFVEQRIRRRESSKQTVEGTEGVAFDYFHKALAIDDRLRLLNMVSDTEGQGSQLTMAVVLDDATETIMDLLWMQELMERFPRFRINLLVNTAQISVNFSTHMLRAVLSSPCFKQLASRVGDQLQITKMYCPFISFQTNYLPPEARQVIEASDVVYIKGANFFETCQILEKDSFHAFVVFGPVSRTYTGLKDYDGVFAFIPAGMAGYVHHARPEEIITLRDILSQRQQRGPAVKLLARGKNRD